MKRGTRLNLEILDWLKENSYKLSSDDIISILKEKFNYRIGRNYTTIFKKYNLSYIKRSKKYNFDENIFDNINTKESAWLLGIFLSDGSMRIEKTSVRWIVKDLQILETINTVMRSNVPIKSYFQNGKQYFRLEFYSKKMIDSLIKLKIPETKYRECIFPEINDSLYWHLIRGIHCGDGSNYISRNTLHCAFSGCFTILNHVKEFANLTQKLSRDNRTFSSYNLKFQGKDAITFLNKMYFDSEGLRLERKFLVYDNFINNKTI